MSRIVPFDLSAVCDECGTIGAYDFMGDFLCQKCAELYIPAESDERTPMTESNSNPIPVNLPICDRCGKLFLECRCQQVHLVETQRPESIEQVRRFRKKPVVIHAIQWNGSNGDEIADFLGRDRGANLDDPLSPVLVIETLEGNMTAQIGDWIIRGVKGEFYPCKPDIFTATYDPE